MKNFHPKSRNSLIATVLLSVLSAAHAWDPKKDLPEEQAACPNALPAYKTPYIKGLKKYSDWRSNPNHSQNQYKGALVAFNIDADCRNAIPAYIGVLSYEAYQAGEKNRTLEALKKKWWGENYTTPTKPDEALFFRLGNEAFDMAYEGKKQEAIIRALYCKCLSLHPEAPAALSLRSKSNE